MISILKIRNSFITKIISIILIISLFIEIFRPQQLYSLTGGPSQPEMTGFTPINTDENVDPFSGDFHYTIPIMIIPGSEGGYPINLNYVSNIGMEQEASWVGLGWNLNPGAINRQVRGLPDDFAGDEIIKTYKRRNNNTVVFTPGTALEIFGGNFGIGANLSKSIVYNTYTGLSLSQRFGVSAFQRNKGEADNYLSLGGNVNLDSDNGMTISFAMNAGEKNLSLGFNYGYNSKNGVYNYSNQLSLMRNRQINTKEGQSGKNCNWGGRMGSSFSSAAILPPISFPLINQSYGLSFQIGAEGGFFEGAGSFSANVALQMPQMTPLTLHSFGLLYADQAEETDLQDYNREKELYVNNNSLNLPLPIMTHDVYCIAGEMMTGSFRAHRSDWGHFYSNAIHNYTNSLESGVDAAIGNGIQIGLSAADNSAFSSSGDWSDQNFISFMNKYEYNNSNKRNISPNLFEPFYFKMMGEQTARSLTDYNEIGETDAVKFDINQQYKHSKMGSLAYNYVVDNNLITEHNEPIQMNCNTLPEREKRTSNIEYEFCDVDSHGRKKNHIKSFSIVNAKGEKYTYGKSLYNHVEKDVCFSLPYQSDNLQNSIVTNYDTKYAKSGTDNAEREGKEKLYSCTQTPAYAYSYLLTGITSYDYVDVDNNGLSDNDLGYWVKFQYTDIYTADNRYAWRFPYFGANFFMGDRSNKRDDKGSYNYGEKEIAYVSRIETKTHYAQFYISPRQDAYGVNNEYIGGGMHGTLYKLDSIKLFSKADTMMPIQTACFIYDYSLCPATPNSNSGKLTLKSVYMKYGQNERGEDTPYYFSYQSYNPSYNATASDRWGTYKGNANYFEHYVTQNKEQADVWASAWALTDIQLPSGGHIQINYESDDYAYVQNKQAMCMVTLNNSTSFSKENGKYYVYFNKSPDTQAAQYISNFKNNLMFFKIAVRYQDENLPDYVQGYVEIVQNNVRDISPTVGAVEVKAFDAYDIHPIYLLCCQYLKNSRPDLLFNGAEESEYNSDMADFFRAINSNGTIAKFYAMYGNDNYYRYCNRQDYYKNISFNNDMPSYVRLNAVNKAKLGGGSRVKRITVHDMWEKSDSSSYCQEYIYKILENGQLISSGVAEYEPMVGAEENCLRYPVYDKVKKLFFVEDEMYSEEPYGESYFPAANVGYRQVTIKTSTPDNVTLSTNGIQVAEYYTAKDFPIFTSQTPLKIFNEKMPLVLSLLTCGFFQSHQAAYSQGYQIELNDMHGKQKSLKTYPFTQSNSVNELLNSLELLSPTSSIEYRYKCHNNKLDNTVDVLVSDGQTKQVTIGQEIDFVVDRKQYESYNLGVGISAQFMLASLSPPFPLAASVLPSMDSYEENIRAIATTKVIYRSGILEQTIASNNGSVIKTTHLQWDPYTGEPLLTTHTNEFNQPVYTYNMPAYWAYPNMGSQAINYRAAFFINDTLHFSKYDRIMSNHFPIQFINNSQPPLAYYWNNNDYTDSIPIRHLEILSSRNSNRLTIMGASITSLTNPQNDRYLPMLEAFNNSSSNCFLYQDCAGNKKYARINYHNNVLYFFDGTYYQEKLCDLTLAELLQNENLAPRLEFYDINLNGHSIFDCRLVKENGIVSIYDRNTQTYYDSFTWIDRKGIFAECLDGVLQASAVEFSNNWKYNYRDAQVPLSVGNRQNYLGINNLYRPLRNNVYITKRRQTNIGNYQSNIAYDGTFDNFSFFRHGMDNGTIAQNPWRWNTEITKYNPHNFEIENKDALSVYSSALYGYHNSLPTAVAQNCNYSELGFTGFEEQPSGSHILTSDGSVTSNFAHTGNKAWLADSLVISTNVVNATEQITNSDTLSLVKDNKYIISCWVRQTTCHTTDNLGIDFYLNTPNQIIKRESKVDGWQRLEYSFIAPNTTQNNYQLTIKPLNGTDKYYFDDVRIMPLNANMKSYVYSTHNYNIIAELDENNYATFYNYDEEGVLVQIKKETERGIQTVQTSRQFIKKH